MKREIRQGLSLKEMKLTRWTAGMILTFIAFLCFFIPSLLQESPSRADFAAVNEATTAGLDMTAYPAADQSLIRSKLSLDPSRYQGVAFYRSLNAMDAEEMLVIQYDPSQKQEVVDKVNARIQSQKDIYKGYAPEQLETLNQAVVSVHPNYLLYVTGPQARQAESQFEEAL